MSPQATATSRAKADRRASLDDFYYHLRYSNPFDQNRVSKSSEAVVDVPAIHRRQYETLIGLAEKARRDGRGIGATLWGQPGVGKSHLLARFSRWARGVDPSGARLGPPQACYVCLHNTHVDPDRLPRYVLKSVVSQLTAARKDCLFETDLYRMLAETIDKAAIDAGVDPASPVSPELAERVFLDLVAARRARDPDSFCVDDDDLWRVLFKFYAGATQARRGQDESLSTLAIRWLGGDTLDQAELASLGLRTTDRDEDGASLPDDQAIERSLIALMNLARMRDMSFVLCFDQVENLSEESFASLARFAHALIDNSPNLLLVTSGLQDIILRSQEMMEIPAASWDRLSEEQIDVPQVFPKDAFDLAQARLQPYLDPFLQIAPVKKAIEQDGYFPLGVEWLKDRLGDLVEIKPRDVIKWCKDRFNDQTRRLQVLGAEAWWKEWPEFQGRRVPLVSREPIDLEKLIDEKVGLKITEQVRLRRIEPDGFPPDGSNLCGLTEALLAQCVDAGMDYTLRRFERGKAARKGNKPVYDLIVHELSPDGKPVSTGLAFVCTGSATSVTHSLKRLVNDPKPPRHVVLVSDERLPLKLTAAGNDYLTKLRARGAGAFLEMQLSFDQAAQLDALAAVVGEANSGDLEVDLPNGASREVGRDEVIASHHRQDRYRQHPLLRELLTEEPVDDGTKVITPPDIDEVRIREFIKAQLALSMGCTSIEIAKKYHAKVDGQATLSEVEVRQSIESVALKMHEERLVNASPLNDYLFLLEGCAA